MELIKLSSSMKNASAFLLSVIPFLLASSADAQTLTIVSGQGQLVQSSTVAAQPLTVQYLDATGKPFPNQTVLFADTQNGAGGYANPGSAVTDVNGMASSTFIGAALNPSSANVTGYTQTNVIASVNSSSVNFFETTASVTSNGGSVILVNLIAPAQGQVLSGGAGSAGTATPIKVAVGSLNTSTGIANVAITLRIDSVISGNPTFSCREGAFVLTDATGTATCTPVFGMVGRGTYSILVGGGYRLFSMNQLTVTVGPPGIITITSGANQAGIPAARLPLPVVATVADLAGNLISGAQVVFDTIPANAATFSGVVSTSDANGRVSAYVILGTTPGPFQVRVRDVGNLVASPPLATETVNITISGLNKVSGDGQTAFVNAAFAQPLAVQVLNATMQPVPSASVTFAVTTGSATVSPAVVLSDANGNASTMVTAGATAGPITITATSFGFSQTFSLTANPPGPTNFSYANGASFVSNFISPGSIVTINAQGLLTGNVAGVVGGTLVGALPYTVAGVSVTIDNIPAPIFNVSNINGAQAVTVQIPFEVRAATVPITIAVAGGGSTSAFVTVLPVSPGIFETVGADNRRRVVALRPNGTVVTTANPAGRGENVRVYLTGLGPVSPAVPTGAFGAAGSDPAVSATLVAGINGSGVTVVQAIYARDLIGVDELTITIPTDTVAFPSGTDSFLVAVYNSSGSYVYSQLSAIAIQ